jgi:two-component system, NtrC family, sensor histidine kinase HydH
VEDIRPRTTLFCAILAFAIAVSMVLRGRRAVHWLFFAFAADVAFWYASQSLFDLFKNPAWVRATAVLTVLLPQFAVYLFQQVAPEGEGAPPPRLPRFATLLGIPMMALELSPYHATSISRVLAYVYVFGLLAAALLSLARRGQLSPSRAVRDRVRFLFLVGVLATTFTLADFSSFLGGAFRHLPPIGAVFSTVFLFVLAESLTRPRLADLYEMAGRLLVSTALAFCLAGIFYLFVTYVGRFNTYLNSVLAAIIFLVLFEPLQTEVETRIHQFFFRERYDLETTVTALRRRLAHVLEIDEMVGTLLDGLESSRRVTSTAIYLRDQESDGFDLVGSVGAMAPKRIESLTARPLLDRLIDHASISLEEVARERKEEESPLLTAATSLGALKGCVLLRVKADLGDLVGLICVADDRVRDAFTPEEITLLETVASQIGVAIANSRIYSRMKERDRLATLGALAAGLAHEVKNPLGAIKGAAQLLEELDGPATGDPTSKEFIGIILEEVDRLNRVVGSFLDYARPRAGNPVPLDINAAVRRTIQILSSQLTESVVDLRLELHEPLGRAQIDPEQFRQVLINLVQNAMQAMDGEGRVTVSTAQRRIASATWAPPAPERSSANLDDSSRDQGPAPMSIRRAQPEELDMIEVSVRDTGPGISQKVLKNLFIPFFTTKDKGTGLGLAISQSLVQNAGGTIDVQTQSGAGTTFTILLPLSRGLAAATETAAGAEPSVPQPAV